MAAPHLNIAAIARRTGVAPDTLRKWEQRYGVLQPARSSGGQRRYTETDVQRVEWLRDRIRDGWRIGEAARVLDDACSAALDEPEELRNALIASIRRSEPQALSATLDQTSPSCRWSRRSPTSSHPRCAGSGTRGTMASCRSRRSMR